MDMACCAPRGFVGEEFTEEEGLVAVAVVVADFDCDVSFPW